MKQLISQLNQAARRIRNDPKTSLMVVLILALAIGLNVSFFTVVHSVLLRALPFQAPQELVLISSDSQRLPGRDLRVSGPDFQAFKDRLRSFSHIEAFYPSSVLLSDGPLSQEGRGARVTAGFFDLLGTSAQAGRLFSPLDPPDQAQPTVVLSSRFARSRFGSAARAVAQSIRLGEQLHTVIGVLPEDFRFFVNSRPADLWLPIPDQQLGSANRRTRILAVIGRLQPSATLEQARSELQQVTASLAQQFPDTNQGIGAHLDPLHEKRLGHLSYPFLVLGAGLAVILLIACCNASALLLGKGAAFRGEFAVRLALGARRRQLLAQSLSYSLCLALLGGLAGLLLAASGVGLLQALLPADLPRADQIRIEGAVILFVLGISLLAGLLLGLFPALMSTRLSAAAALGNTWRDSLGQPKESRWLGGILAAQAALALVLSIAAILLIQSYWNASQVDPGFERDNVLTARMSFPRQHFPESARIPAVAEEIQAQLESLEPVRAFGWNLAVPFAGGGMLMSYWTDLEAAPPPGDEPEVQAGAIQGDYFQALGIPLLAGRAFVPQDGASAEPVCIVNQAFAARHWPEGQAVGRRINFRWRRTEVSRLVVGVVGTVKHDSPISEWTEKIYVPFAQHAQYYGTIVLKTSQSPESLFSDVKERIAQAAPNSTLESLSTLQQSVSGLLAQRLFFTRLFTLLALAGLALVAAGIASLVQFSVSRRVREMGIRIALGARPGDVLWASLRGALAFTLAGTLIGLGGAYGLTHFLSAWLYELTPTDAASYAAVCSLMVLTALASAWLSARRALRLDPIEALRCL